MASNTTRNNTQLSAGKLSNLINITDRYPLKRMAKRFAYVSKFYSEHYQQTYIIFDIREYNSLDIFPDGTLLGKPAIKGVALKKEELEEFCTILPKIKEDFENKLAVAETIFKIKSMESEVPAYYMNSLTTNRNSGPSQILGNPPII